MKTITVKNTSSAHITLPGGRMMPIGGIITDYDASLEPELDKYIQRGFVVVMKPKIKEQKNEKKEIEKKEAPKELERG